MDVVTLVDLVLVVLAIEALVLAWASRGAGRLPRFVTLLPNLGAGLCLVVAVRVVAESGPLVAVGGLLAAAGLCHVADLLSRVRR